MSGKASSHPRCHSSGHFFSMLKLFAKHVSLREGTTIQMDDRPARTDGRHEVEGKVGENNLFESSRSTRSRGVVIADLK